MIKKRMLVSSLLVFFLLFGLAGPVFAKGPGGDFPGERRGAVTFDFTDSQDAAWAESYIGKMQSMEVIKGYEDGSFRPNAPVKRIEAIVMAVRLMGLEEEALAKAEDATLHFKDARTIPAWAKGHVAVALENGLFETSENVIQSEKPASRVWIVSLLVKALGLEEAALAQMTEVPDFKDAEEIPAGAIGYVQVGLENDLITGYDDNTFKPNKPVTRGEMAALLERTNDGLLEQDGAITVQGEVTAVSFPEAVQEEVAVDGEAPANTVASSSDATEGSITIATGDGQEGTYTIASDLLVQYDNTFIPASELVAGDFVTLIVINGAVTEANIVDEESINLETNIIELEIALELTTEESLELEYTNKKGKVEAEISVEAEDYETKLEGQEAIDALEELMQLMALTSDMTEEQIIEAVLTALAVDGQLLEELEIEVKFSNGAKAEIEWEQEEDEDDDE